jgi:hypothetical protein
MPSEVDAALSAAEGFEWDEPKRAANLDKHGIDFIDAIACFEGPMLVRPSERNSEARYLALGKLKERVVAIVFALRKRRIRLISVRMARTDERQAYDRSLG